MITSVHDDDGVRLAERGSNERGLPTIYTHGQGSKYRYLQQHTITNELDFLSWVGRIAEKVPDSTPAKHIKAMQWWHAMGIHDQEDVGAVVRSLPPGTKFIPKAEYPVEVLAGVLHFHPKLLQDQKAHDRLLQEYPEYCDPSYDPVQGAPKRGR